MDSSGAFYQPPLSLTGFYPPPTSMWVFTPSVEDDEAATKSLSQLSRYDNKAVQLAYDELPDTYVYFDDKRRLHCIKRLMETICIAGIEMYAETGTISQSWLEKRRFLPHADYGYGPCRRFDEALLTIRAKMCAASHDDAESYRKKLFDAFHGLCGLYHDTAKGLL
jgi:hypothetical protein